MRDLYNMSDEELEKAFLEAKDELENSEVEISNDEVSADTEQEIPDETTQTSEPSEQSNETTESPDEVFDEISNEPKVETTEADTEIKSNTYRVKANGNEYDFTLEELLMLTPKAMDYTKKTQAIAPYRKTITAMQENGLTHDDINLLIDIKKGNKDAISALVKQTGVDTLDLVVDDEVNYTPNNYGVSEESYNLSQTIERLKNDTEFAQTQQIVSNLDEPSREFFLKNPEALEGLHTDVKSGVFAKVIPNADKLAALDGYKKPLIDYYLIAGNQFFEQELKKAQIEQSKKQEQIATTNKAKKAASLPQGRADKKGVVDYLSEDDEAFEEWYRNLKRNY